MMRGIEPGSRGKFVPHDVGPGREHGELCDIVRNRSARSFDLLHAVPRVILRFH